MLLSASTPIGTAPLSSARIARLREIGHSHAVCFGAFNPDDEDLFMSAILDGDVDPITEDHGQFYEVMEAFIQGAREGRAARLTMLG